MLATADNWAGLTCCSAPNSIKLESASRAAAKNDSPGKNKSTNSGEIVDVEPGEAEGQLDMLEGLFDFYFVQPAILQKMHEALNKKLTKKRKPKLKYIISMGLREDINKDKDKNK